MNVWSVLFLKTQRTVTNNNKIFSIEIYCAHNTVVAAIYILHYGSETIIAVQDLIGYTSVHAY